MNYRRNEDKLCYSYRRGYNAVVDTTITESAPTEPVTRTEAKTHMKVDFTDDDTYIDALITQCRGLMEQATGRSLVLKTVVAIVRNELGGIELPYGPVRAISAVVDEEGETLTVDDTYEVQGLMWTTVTSPTSDFTQFTYTVGHTAGNMPVGLKQALLELIAYKYVHRGDENETDLLKKLNELAAPFKRQTWLL